MNKENKKIIDDFSADCKIYGCRYATKEALVKIKNLHKNHLDLKIAVDGGINLETGKECVQAGASILCAGSYIFESINIEQAINSLKNL